MLPFLRDRGALLRWLLSALVETAVVTPWLLLVYASTGGDQWPSALPGAWLPLLVFLAASLWEAGDRHEDPRRRLYALGAGVLVSYLLAYQAVPAAVRMGVLRPNIAMFFIPVAGYLWYQGAKSAIEGVEYGRIFTRFSQQVGLLLGGMILLMLLGEAGNPKVQLLLYWSIILLFAAGLTLVLITRDRALRVDQAKMGESGAGSGTSHVMIAVVGTLTVLTLAASYLLSVDQLMAAMQGLGARVAPVFDWVFKVAMLIIVRWLILVSPLINMILGRRVEQAEETEQADSEVETPPPPELAETGLPIDITPYLKGLLVALVLFFVVKYLLQLARMRRQAAAEFEEERISLGFWRSLWADLMALFRRGGQGLQPALDQIGEALGLENPHDPRALFRRLQRWGAERGRPRGNAETPTRFGQALGQLRPEAERPANSVTAIYNQARYGRQEPDPTAVERARSDLDRLEKGES